MWFSECGSMPKSTRTEHLVSHSPSNYAYQPREGHMGPLLTKYFGGVNRGSLGWWIFKDEMCMCSVGEGH